MSLMGYRAVKSRWQEAGKKLHNEGVTCTLHQILLGRSNQGGWHERGTGGLETRTKFWSEIYKHKET
jgi:hypothetical protein